MDGAYLGVFEILSQGYRRGLQGGGREIVIWRVNSSVSDPQPHQTYFYFHTGFYLNWAHVLLFTVFTLAGIFRGKDTGHARQGRGVGSNPETVICRKNQIIIK